MKTVLIFGGTVIDPAQNIECHGDIVCVDGKIAEIYLNPKQNETDIRKETADELIDATGKIVAPGFIDIHMHEDPYDPETDTLEQNISKCMVLMGVTTALGGNCGSNCAAPNIYLDAVDRQGAATNIALMVGHTFLRHECGGQDKYAPVNDDIIAEMVCRGEKYLDDGCFGVSFGVKYIPGTRWEEIIALSKLCQKSNKLVSSHVRNDVDGVFDACRELAEIGREAGVKVQFSHVGSMGGYGQMKRLLEQIESYRADGIDIMLGSDGILVGSQGHPRAAGAFPRFLRQYAAGKKMSLSDAIAKVTTMPAKRLKLERKGNLLPGSDADIVVFDLEQIKDRSTYTQPVLPPDGIDRVLIGGETAVKDGKLIRDDLGRSVRA